MLAATAHTLTTGRRRRATPHASSWAAWCAHLVRLVRSHQGRMRRSACPSVRKKSSFTTPFRRPNLATAAAPGINVPRRSAATAPSVSVRSSASASAVIARPVGQAASASDQAPADVPSASSRCSAVLFAPMKRKKHRNWEDGFVCLVNGGAMLFNAEGRVGCCLRTGEVLYM